MLSLPDINKVYTKYNIDFEDGVGRKVGMYIIDIYHYMRKYNFQELMTFIRNNLSNYFNDNVIELFNNGNIYFSPDSIQSDLRCSIEYALLIGSILENILINIVAGSKRLNNELVDFNIKNNKDLSKIFEIIFPK